MEDANPLSLFLHRIEMDYYPDGEDGDLYYHVTDNVERPDKAETVKEYCARHDGLECVQQDKPLGGSLGEAFVCLAFCYEVEMLTEDASFIVYVVYDYRADHPYTGEEFAYVSTENEYGEQYVHFPLPDSHKLADLKIGDLMKTHEMAIKLAFPALLETFRKIAEKWVK